MMRNACKSWTDEELTNLDQMVRDRFSMRSIAKTLARSENAVRNAFRNIVFHQLLDYDAETVAKQYHLTMHELYNDIVHPKYALTPADNRTTRAYWAALATFLTVGCAYYAHLVFDNWSKI